MKLFRLLTVAILLIATNTANAQCVSPTLDGYTYDVVQIGDQCWFAENLRTTILQDGTPIPEVSDFDGTDFSSANFWFFVWDGDIMRASLPDTLEGLSDYNSHVYYNGLVPISTQHGLASPCPVGWRVPIEEDWTTLLNYVETLPDSTIHYNLYTPGPALSYGCFGCEFGAGPNQINSNVPAWSGNNDLGFNIRPTGQVININVENLGTTSVNQRIDWFQTVKSTKASVSIDPVYSNVAPRHLYGETPIARYWMNETSGGTTFSMLFEYNDPNSLATPLVYWPWRAGACIRCIFSNPEITVPGCTDIIACNYDPEANLDDGSCEYPQEGYDCECNAECWGDFDDNGSIGVSDLLLLLTAYGNTCADIIGE